ncbi:hypothetical protein BT67DRAFT_162666 [Trichocladium antarcticum]|uniref:Uncharacterized protein n=1 Tax=Trichocladium antarcticum TaxID=1450529 RepID=A0AAN6ZAS1_9PEZI|nr:hypothetical protein BT67DRAFT_162666 [Trichocladium antarcticum]
MFFRCMGEARDLVGMGRLLHKAAGFHKSPAVAAATVKGAFHHGNRPRNCQRWGDDGVCGSGKAAPCLQSARLAPIGSNSPHAQTPTSVHRSNTQCHTWRKSVVASRPTISCKCFGEGGKARGYRDSFVLCWRLTGEQRGTGSVFPDLPLQSR